MLSASEMTYIVSSGALNSTHSLTKNARAPHRRSLIDCGPHGARSRPQHRQLRSLVEHEAFSAVLGAPSLLVGRDSVIIGHRSLAGGLSLIYFWSMVDM